MKLDEKFRAKAIIDIFAYRTSKGILSCSLIALQWVAGSYLLPLASYLATTLFLLWMVVAYRMFRTQKPRMSAPVNPI